MHEQLLKNSLEELKSKGIRITPQRHAILDYLIQSKSHPTADEIYKSLEGKFPNMSVATVYNNLRALRDIGMIKELNYGDASSRFDFWRKDHYHVICEDCGLMVDFDYPNLDDVEKVAADTSGFEVTHHRLEVYGKCPNCKTK